MENSLLQPAKDAFRDRRSVSFVTLDGDDPRNWTIWNVCFSDLQSRTRSAEDRLLTPVSFECFLLDDALDGLRNRDSWTNVIGCLIHISIDDRQMSRVRDRHSFVCAMLKRDQNAMYRKTGYNVFAVDDQHLENREWRRRSMDLLADARLYLGECALQLHELDSPDQFDWALRFMLRSSVLRYLDISR
jgi:hypothetical protein